MLYHSSMIYCMLAIILINNNQNQHVSQRFYSFTCSQFAYFTIYAIGIHWLYFCETTYVLTCIHMNIKYIYTNNIIALYLTPQYNILFCLKLKIENSEKRQTSQARYKLVIECVCVSMNLSIGSSNNQITFELLSMLLLLLLTNFR